MAFAKALAPDELKAGADDWRLLARPEQLAPAGPWRTWVFLGGRGAGKTRAGAEWLNAEAKSGRRGRLALIAPTFHDAREVLIEGASGLLSLAGPRPLFEVSRRRLSWESGAVAYVFSAEDPDSLRGPQFDGAWADEFCAWADPAAVLATLRPGLRLGADPRLIVTTTPKPIAALKDLLAEPDTVRSHAPTAANAENLAPGFVEALQGLWGGTVYGRQELGGELIADPEGALWTRALIARAVPRGLDDAVVAVDPPAGTTGDACGIVAVGCAGEGSARLAYVLGDASAQGLRPEVWAERAAALAESVGASRIIAEANQGGEMVRSVLSIAAPEIPVRLVRASLGKRARAEPIAALYAQGRVKHAGVFAALEDELCGFGAEGFSRSPDRLDALVWAVSELMLARAEPRLRRL